MRDTSYHKTRLNKRLEDPEFKAEYERARQEIDAIDSVIRQLDERREENRLTKADLARAIGKNPASIRRLFTAKGNPQLSLVAAVAQAVDAEIQVVPRKRRRMRPTGQAT